LSLQVPQHLLRVGHRHPVLQARPERGERKPVRQYGSTAGCVGSEFGHADRSGQARAGAGCSSGTGDGTGAGCRRRRRRRGGVERGGGVLPVIGGSTGQTSTQGRRIWRRLPPPLICCGLSLSLRGCTGEAPLPLGGLKANLNKTAGSAPPPPEGSNQRPGCPRRPTHRPTDPPTCRHATSHLVCR
jgi:hypothetical protein